MGACAATRIGEVEAPGNEAELFYASGSRGKSVTADGHGGTLARGWYKRPADGGSLGPFPTKTAARTASAEAAEVLGDPTAAAEAQKEAAPLGYVRVPAGTHPEAYGLTIDEYGAGRFAPPGSSVVVEPVAPRGAGLAVLYRNGRPEVWDLTHNFVPGSFDKVSGAGLAHQIEMIEPQTGRLGRAYASSFEKAHRVSGVYIPEDVMAANPRTPIPLPVMRVCPEGMGEQVVDSASAYPMLRPGETAVFDPSMRELKDGALCVLQWSNGHRSILQTNRRSFAGNDADHWMVDPVNRPGSTALLERRLERGLSGGLMFASDGPYYPENLRSKIVGHVVGVLVPHAVEADATAPDSDAPEKAAVDEVSLEINEAIALATLPFTPIDQDTPCPIPSNAQWVEDAKSVLPFLRMGWATLAADRHRLVEVAAALSDDDFQALTDSLGRSRRNFEQLARLAREAGERLMIGTALHLLREEGIDPDRNRPTPAVLLEPVPPGITPKLAAMIEEWTALGERVNDESVSDDEAETLGCEHTACQIAIYNFPAASVADLFAKVPVFRDEMQDAIGGLNKGGDPRGTLSGAAWLGLFRDFERLATPGDDRVADQILASWREFAPAMLTGQGGIDSDEEANRLQERQRAALRQADDLPAALDHVLSKALALAAIEITELERPSKVRASHDMRSRLLLDIHAAITGVVVLED